MSTALDRTHQDMIAEAAAILTAVREARWPDTREAQKAIGWAFAAAADWHVIYAAVLNGDIYPYAVGAPDMAWWDDPERQALEYVADQALEAAKAARKRLDEYTRSEGASKRGGAAA